MNGLNLTLQAITPPANLAHVNRAQEITDLPTYLRVNATALAELTMLYVSTATPGSSHTDKIWLKTDDSGTPRGLYAYISGVWTPMSQELYVGTTAPTNTYVAWLRTADDGADFMGLYIYSGGAWIPTLIRSVNIGASAPANTTVLWVKTDDTGTIKGVYAYIGATWTLLADSEPCIVQSDSTPTQASRPVWAKTGDTGTPRGIYVHDGASYERLAYANAKEVILQATAPAASLWIRYLWAKSSTPTGLFRSDGTHWLSIGDIYQSQRHPAAGTVTVPAGPTSGVEYGTFPVAYGSTPFVTVDLEYDSSTEDLRWYIVPTLTGFEFHWYTADTSAREIALRWAAWGAMTI